MDELYPKTTLLVGFLAPAIIVMLVAHSMQQRNEKFARQATLDAYRENLKKFHAKFQG